MFRDGKHLFEYIQKEKGVSNSLLEHEIAQIYTRVEGASVALSSEQVPFTSEIGGSILAADRQSMLCAGWFPQTRKVDRVV